MNRFPKPAGPPSRKGFTLVITLLILSVVTVLVVGLFGLADGERNTAASFDAIEQADLAVKAGLAQASAVLDEVTRTEDAVIFNKPVGLPTGDTSLPDAEAPNEYLMAAKYVPEIAAWEYIPLVSGMESPPNTAKLSMNTNGDGLPDSPAPKVPHSPEDLQDLAAAPFAPAHKAPRGRTPVRYWETMVLPQEVGGDGGDQIVARYCFSVEDLQGYLSLEVAGNLDGEVPSGPPGSNEKDYMHVRPEMKVVNAAAGVAEKDARVIVPGLSLPPPDRNPTLPWTKPLLDGIALYTLIDHTAPQDGPAIREDNRLVTGRDLLVSPDSWKQVLLNPSDSSNPDPKRAWQGVPESYFDRNTNTNRIYHGPARRLEEAAVASHVPYLERAIIPHFEGIAEAGSPKLNLNKLIEELDEVRELRGQDSLEAQTKEEQTVNAIAEHINKHIPDRPGAPGFARGRRGGYWMGGDQAKRDADEDGLWDPPTKEPTEAEKDFAYLQCLAAGIIDYADKDSLPTMRLGHYRGTDSYPIVTETWQGYEFLSPGGSIRVGITDYLEVWNPTNQTIEGEIQMAFDCRGELFTGAIPYSILTMLNEPETYGTEAAIDQNRPVKSSVRSSSRTDWWHPPQPITLKPNEVKVIASPQVGFRLFAAGGAVGEECRYQGDSTAQNPRLTDTHDYFSRYRIKFRPVGTASFRLVDEPPSMTAWHRNSVAVSSSLNLADARKLPGVERRQRRVTRTSRYQYSASAPGMSYGLQSKPEYFRNNLGDPRAAFFIYYPQDTITMWDSDSPPESGTSPWTRNLRRNISTNSLFKEARYHLWPDGGHSVPVSQSSRSGLNSNHTVSPLAARPNPMPPEEPEKFIQVIANRGRKLTPTSVARPERLHSVTELGHVFDPIMWDPDGGTEESTPTYLDFADISRSAQASSGFCGGNTLRIGRPEHSRFRPHYGLIPIAGRPADRRLCATVLLDLFHCGVPLSENPDLRRGALIQIDGHVNINTASRDVLRALVAGRLVADKMTKLKTSDAALADVHPPRDVTKLPNASGAYEQADLIADEIIRHRPYVSVSELPERVTTAPAKLGMTGTQEVPVLGNTKRTGTQAGSTVFEPEWNDAAAEEAFARIFNSSTVRSRNFRIVVTGQAVKRTPSGATHVLATRSRVYHVFVKPERDPTTGIVLNQKIEITYARSL